MFTGKKVKIRFKRFFAEQRVRVLVGTVLEMNNDWLKVRGKNFFLVKGDGRPRIDDSDKIIGVPRENIYSIRELPDDLDLDNFSFDIVDLRMVIKVPGEQATSVSE